jgi:hypothetical protein
MADKKITIEKLAVIINKGFQGQMDYMEKKFALVATKKELDEIKKDVKYIKENVDDAAKLAKEVEYIRNTFSIPTIKK